MFLKFIQEISPGRKSGGGILGGKTSGSHVSHKLMNNYFGFIKKSVHTYKK